jgi:hypothetical protein
MFATDGRTLGFDGVQPPAMIGICATFDDLGLRIAGFEAVHEPVVMAADGVFVAKVGAAANSAARVRTTRGSFIVVPPVETILPGQLHDVSQSRKAISPVKLLAG